MDYDYEYNVDLQIPHNFENPWNIALQKKYTCSRIEKPKLYFTQFCNMPVFSMYFLYLDIPICHNLSNQRINILLKLV